MGVLQRLNLQLLLQSLLCRNSAFAGVQLEYDRFSRLSVWRWGALTEKYGYDRAGRLSEIRYADDTSTVYAFKDMFSSLVSLR